MLGQLTKEFLGNMGYKDTQVNTVFHQYMAAFPENQERAADLIYNSAITAKLSKAVRVIVKTPVEALKIPTREDNIQAISLVRRGVAVNLEQSRDDIHIAQECGIIRHEVEAILESVVFSGHGDLARGVVNGFKKGFIDIPFSPSIHNRGEVMTARDNEGAVRFLSMGNLQLDRELRQFHNEKMAERRRKEGLRSSNQDFLLVEQDVLRIARCDYNCWPLFGEAASRPHL
jgi:methylaspartate mutase epsilon subunit